MSVILHEFAHGIVAYWGGDYTIRERGGLTLNPFQYVDPVFSIALPVLFLFLGGVPLPGGVTYVRRDLLRNRAWDTAVSLAGPAANLLIFLGCVIPLHPKLGWLNAPHQPEWTQAQLLLGAMAVLQMLAIVLNLVPVPPLDGFQAISPWLPGHIREKLSMPPWNIGLTIAFFVLIMSSGLTQLVFDHLLRPVLGVIGFDEDGQDFFRKAFNLAISKY
jgi:Zn-dependent protease